MESLIDTLNALICEEQQLIREQRVLVIHITKVAH